jgi:hypothetical protein
MTPGDIVLGILGIASIVGLVTVSIAMEKELRAGRVFVVGIVTRLRKRK